MSGHTIPDDMTGAALRQVADILAACGSPAVAGRCRGWADEIDPPRMSVVTDQMVAEVCREAGGYLPVRCVGDLLRAAERLGYLFDPDEVAAVDVLTTIAEHARMLATSGDSVELELPDGCWLNGEAAALVRRLAGDV